MAHPYKNRLLVEGPYDTFAYRSLLKRHKISCIIETKPPKNPEIEEHTIGIQESEGFEALRNSIPTYIKADSELERLGIVVDADDRGKVNRWESIRDVLAKFEGATLPATPKREGTVTTVIRPEEGKVIVVGVWLMPDNNSDGALEDFIRPMVPSTQDPLWVHAEDSVKDIPNKAKQLFRSVDAKKAYLHTWLAWQKRPGVQLSNAIDYGYLDTNTPLAESFIKWVRLLFDLPLP